MQKVRIKHLQPGCLKEEAKIRRDFRISPDWSTAWPIIFSESKLNYENISDVVRITLRSGKILN